MAKIVFAGKIVLPHHVGKTSHCTHAEKILLLNIAKILKGKFFYTVRWCDLNRF